MSPTATPSAADPMTRYEAVIGIEVHCQLRTASKMFCACSTAYDGARAQQPHLPGLPGPAGRAAGHQPTRRRARPRDRPRHRGDDAGRHPLGPQELLLSRPAQGLPDQPVRPAARLGRPAGRRDVRGPVRPSASPGRISRRTRPSSCTRTDRGRAQGEPGRLQPLRRPAHGDRHRPRHPVGRAGAPLRRGAAAAAAHDRRVRRRHGAWPDAGRGQRLAPGPRARRRSGRASRSRT